MGQGPEFTDVEKPFLDQLADLGWRVVTGSVEFPSVSGRGSFREVLLKKDLAKALRRINRRDGEPWLDQVRISQAVSALERIGAQRLIEANRAASELLHTGIDVEGLEDWDQGRSRTIHYFDWNHPENNDFTAVNQFRVDRPGGQAKSHVVPDIVLFVNGIPIGVVECKSPKVSEPMAAAVDQLRRYHNQRRADGEVEDDEGNERLFHTNQFLVATYYDEARVGTIGADLRHYMEWKDTAPVPLDEVRAELGKDKLSSQNTLIAGLLRPAHLIDVLRHFTLFKEQDGKTVKIVCRYQQFRAVRYAADRLLTGKTRREDGEHDRRSGIVWHTQGSGKSLTMVFLVRKLRSTPELRRFKVIVVTDRKDLERQLAGTAELSGETVHRARNVRDVKKLLAVKGPGLVFAMIQKYGDRDLPEWRRGDQIGDLGLLNKDESILVLVDEAHRSHASSLHANLLAALPNCARIGFTGTPIIMGEKRRTHEIFGEFIDRYTIKQSEADGTTVPILYEGRTADGAVADGRDLDQLFEDFFRDHSQEQLEAIKRKYATRGSILEAPKLIEAKARDMLRHYVEHILPSGLKAQVVVCSRRAAVGYRQAFLDARDELVAAATALDEDDRGLDDLELEHKPRTLRAAVRAWRHLDVLERLEFEPVISAAHNDPSEWQQWSDAGKIEARTERFRKPLLSETSGGEDGDDDNTDPLAFLIVKSMLLTGFDAPIEGVMYLDRPIREAELLQAIARVNRTGYGKQAGIVVDYYGVARHLTEALAAYSAEDVEGALRSLDDEIPKLRDRHQRLIDFFGGHGLEHRQVEDCVYLLEAPRLRAEYAVKLKQFLATLDLVLPRPEGLPYVRDAAIFGEIYTRAQQKYHRRRVELSKGVGRKVRRLIGEHVIALGIDPKIPPLEIGDPGFAAHIARQVSDRAKASEMEHAVRHHIRKKLDEDPVRYRKLSERLEEILAKFGQDWKQLVLALEPFIQEVEGGRTTDADLGLDAETEMPFYDLLADERGREQPVTGSDRPWLAGHTSQLVSVITDAIGVVGFWKNATRQQELRGLIFQFLDDNEIIDFDRADAVADRLLELAKANRHKLVRR